MHMKKRMIIAATFSLFIILMMVGFYNMRFSQPDKEISQEQLVIVSPHPVEFIKPLINEFESGTGIKCKVTQCGTAKALEAIREDENIDILWGGSILSVGENEGVFLPYKTSNTYYFGEEFKNPGEGITCFSEVPSIIMVNSDLAGDITIDGYEDLLKPELKGKIAFADPSKSSSSFEHLTNMLYDMGDGNPENGWDFVEKFIGQLDGELSDSSSRVYEGVSSGKYYVGLTFEEAAVTMIKKNKHVKIVYMSEGVLLSPDGIYINSKTRNEENARRFVDFMTAYDTQNFISKKLGRRSIRTDIEDSELVKPRKELNKIKVDKETVACKKQEWIEKFSAMMQ
ncbi:extracellular solute-binding protein [Butyrivibrio sp. AE3004]|uniref:extracellular solute-binding protein n=1 Tax=Butyrivibrio sp. AE3004 TaxID=1506994 RepID=UPI0006916563|nr:extracellular solute-binding protein [Butyrivibrio sp. AE3004]